MFEYVTVLTLQLGQTASKVVRPHLGQDKNRTVELPHTSHLAERRLALHSGQYVLVTSITTTPCLDAIVMSLEGPPVPPTGKST